MGASSSDIRASKLIKPESDAAQKALDWTPNIIAGLMALGTVHLWTAYLRRIPGSSQIQPSFFRKRSLFGRVTSVGDGDGFHMFHTPGGRWAGWGWLRRIPSTRIALKGKTIPIRLAGIDAPEGAHFGRPAQPYSAESLDWLTKYVLHRPVRAYIWKRDQYERIVATVYVRRWLFFRKDISFEMLACGLATTYEAKSGAEYGGLEEKYRIAEVKAKMRKVGMWSGKPEFFESPRAYKAKWAAAEKEQESKKDQGKDTKKAS